MSLFLHFSSTYIHQDLEIYSSLYSEGFYRRVCLYIICPGLYNILFLKTWRKCTFLKAVSLFLHFSSTYIHQDLEIYSSLYSEGFYRRVCLYIICPGLYNLLFLKTWRKCTFLKAVSLFLHFSSTYIHQILEFYSSLYSEGFYRGVCLCVVSLILFLNIPKKHAENSILSLLTVFSDLWSNKKRNPKSLQL